MNDARISSATLKKKIGSVEDAASLIRSGMTVAFGGQVSVGSPKAIPKALVERKRAGEPLALNVLSTSSNAQVDDILAESGIVQFRAPMTDSRILSKQANRCETIYYEQQINKLPGLLRSGCLGKIDVAVVEALGITEDGCIIPTTSIAMEDTLLRNASQIIVEVNRAFPFELRELHDVFQGDYSTVPPFRLTQRIGKPFLRVDTGKICCIVFTEEFDRVPVFSPPQESQKRIAEHLTEFLLEEKRRAGWNKLPPLQTGFGNLANEIIRQMQETQLDGLSFFAGHLQEENLRMLISGQAEAACCASLQLSPDSAVWLADNMKRMKERIVIRNAELVNNSATISRLSPITLTSGIEMDIYGNVNSSHISGANVVNGIGGGANFAQNAGLSILLMASEGKNGSISNIVPMVSHQDIGEHDIDVVITENGVADLRGKCDRERAALIIGNCSCSYRPQLEDYFHRACARGGHHPVLLEEALSWHVRFRDTGTMR